MKRLHLHIATPDLDRSIAFYTALLGSAPVFRKPDYARWLVDEPALHLALSQGEVAAIDHLGIQSDTAGELEEVRTRLQASAILGREEQAVGCCYARSDKAWSTDPQGIAWEAFHSHGEADTLAWDGNEADSDACCIPLANDRENRCCLPHEGASCC